MLFVSIGSVAPSARDGQHHNAFCIIDLMRPAPWSALRSCSKLYEDAVKTSRVCARDVVVLPPPVSQVAVQASDVVAAAVYRQSWVCHFRCLP